MTAFIWAAVFFGVLWLIFGRKTALFITSRINVFLMFAIPFFVIAFVVAFLEWASGTLDREMGESLFAMADVNGVTKWGDDSKSLLNSVALKIIGVVWISFVMACGLYMKMFTNFMPFAMLGALITYKLFKLLFGLSRNYLANVNSIIRES